MGKTFKELEEKNGRKKDRVEIENLYAWDCSFTTADLDKHEYHKGYLMSGGKRNNQLSLEEVYAQVREVQNPFFVGKDGFGTHAALRIVDPVVRAYCFDVDKIDPLQLTKENIKKLLEMDDRAEFIKFMNELIVTESEAKQIAYLVDNNMLGLDDMAGWKRDTVRLHVYGILGIKQYNYYA